MDKDTALRFIKVFIEMYEEIEQSTHSESIKEAEKIGIADGLAKLIRNNK